MSQFENFLSQYAVFKKNNPNFIYTHTSMTGGSWNIPENKTKLFFSKYSKALKTAELHFTEKHIPNFGPIIIDFDFKFKTDSIPRIIDRNVIENVVDTITNILMKVFDPNKNYTCVVLQRPSGYQKGKIWTDGLHIQFPYIVCKYSLQHALRNKFISHYKFKFQCENELDNIYDKYVIEVTNWCMYGSTKRNIKPYEIVAIYNSDLKKEDLNTYNCVELLSIRNKLKYYIDPINDKLNKYLYHEKKLIIINSRQLDNYKDKLINEEKDCVNIDIIADQEYNEFEIIQLLNILDEKRRE